MTSKDHTRPGDNGDTADEEIVWEHPAITNITRAIDQTLEPFREMQRLQDELLRHQQEQLKRAMGLQPVRRRKQPALPAKQQPVQTRDGEQIVTTPLKHPGGRGKKTPDQWKREYRRALMVARSLIKKGKHRGAHLQQQDLAEELEISPQQLRRVLHEENDQTSWKEWRLLVSRVVEKES